MSSGREQYLQALAGLSALTRERAERIAGMLARQGEVQSGQVGRVAEDLLKRTQKNREQIARIVSGEVKRQMGLLGIASRDEVARLQQRVRALEELVGDRPPARAAAAPAPVEDEGPAPGAPPATRRTRSDANAGPDAAPGAPGGGDAAAGSAP